MQHAITQKINYENENGEMENVGFDRSLGSNLGIKVIDPRNGKIQKWRI